MPKWVTFTLQGARGIAEKRVSLNQRGVFTLNQLAFDALGSPVAVELMYDQEERLIGLKPSTLDIKHAYKVRRQGKNKSWLIGAKAFCHFFHIDISQTMRFENVEVVDDVMVLDLKTTSTVTPRTRTTKGNVQSTSTLFEVDDA